MNHHNTIFWCFWFQWKTFLVTKTSQFFTTLAMNTLTIGFDVALQLRFFTILWKKNEKMRSSNFQNISLILYSIFKYTYILLRTRSLGIWTQRLFVERVYVIDLYYLASEKVPFLVFLATIHNIKLLQNWPFLSDDLTSIKTTGITTKNRILEIIFLGVIQSRDSLARVKHWYGLTGRQ